MKRCLLLLLCLTGCTPLVTPPSPVLTWDYTASPGVVWEVWTAPDRASDFTLLAETDATRLPISPADTNAVFKVRARSASGDVGDWLQARVE